MTYRDFQIRAIVLYAVKASFLHLRSRYIGFLVSMLFEDPRMKNSQR